MPSGKTQHEGMTQQQEQAGMTLLSLIVTISIVAVLLGSGVPGFRQLVLNNKRTATINELVVAIQFSRSESAKRYQEIVLCPSAGGNQCAGRRWDQGWLVFANTDRDSPARLDPDETLLFRHRVVDGVEIMSNRSAFRFRPLGVRSVNGTIVICDIRGASSARAVIISYTGRPRVADRDASGRSLRCP